MDKIEDDEPIDDILKAVRKAIIDKERMEYFKSFLPKKTHVYEHEEVFELSKSMLVNREDLPYWLGMWNFDVVAKKMLKKYKMYFMTHGLSKDGRVRVKEEKKA